jgi:hypothetical protein
MNSTEIVPELSRCVLDAAASIARSLKRDLSGRAASAPRPPVLMRRRKEEPIPSPLFALGVRATLKQEDVANQFITIYGGTGNGKASTN